MVSFTLITLYGLIPMGVAIIGGLVASLYTPKPKLTGALQHFVAGIVIGAVAIELLPKILHQSSWTVGIGFVIGVALMVLLHEFSHFLARKQKKVGLPYGLITAAAVDLLIDGILIGVAFLAGEASGILIAVSLSLCAFFLNLTVASTLTMRKVARGVQWLAIVGISVMLPIGALIGSSVIAQFPPQ